RPLRAAPARAPAARHGAGGQAHGPCRLREASALAARQGAPRTGGHAPAAHHPGEEVPVSDLVVQRPEGLYCPPGDFYIDPWRPVDRAVITHAHFVHARVGHGHYLAHDDSAGTLRARLGDIALQTLP